MKKKKVYHEVSEIGFSGKILDFCGFLWEKLAIMYEVLESMHNFFNKPLPIPLGMVSAKDWKSSNKTSSIICRFLSKSLGLVIQYCRYAIPVCIVVFWR